MPERIKSVRERHQWTQQQLADRMKAIGNGAKIDRSTIAKVESLNRAVTVDEVFWFAAALDVSPLALLLPQRSDDEVRVAPGFPSTSVTGLVSWYRGLRPLILRSDDSTEVRFFNEQRPDYEVTAERRLPGVLRLVEMADGVVAAVAENKAGRDVGSGATRAATGDRGAVWALEGIAEMASTLRERLCRARGW